jgi:hypothetical protein
MPLTSRPRDSASPPRAPGLASSSLALGPGCQPYLRSPELADAQALPPRRVILAAGPRHQRRSRLHPTPRASVWPTGGPAALGPRRLILQRSPYPCGSVAYAVMHGRGSRDDLTGHRLLFRSDLAPILCYKYWPRPLRIQSSSTTSTAQ